MASFVAGFVTTLSNPKAILFYLSFFPAFFEVSSLSIFDTACVYIIATLAVGGVMFGYAFLAHKAKSVYSGSGGSRLFKTGSGALLIGSGIYVASKG